MGFELTTFLHGKENMVILGPHPAADCRTHPWRGRPWPVAEVISPASAARKTALHLPQVCEMLPQALPWRCRRAEYGSPTWLTYAMGRGGLEPPPHGL